MRRSALFVLPVLLATVAAPPLLAETKQTSVTVNPALAAAVGDARRDVDRARDQWRKPAETLAFFGVDPGMKVGEYAPGGEWYSRLLGLYLGRQGQLVGLYSNPLSGPFDEKTQGGDSRGGGKISDRHRELVGHSG